MTAITGVTGWPHAPSQRKKSDMTRNKKIGVGQRAVLEMGIDGPIDRKQLSQGQKAVLHGLKRIGLVDAQDRTTPDGVRALQTGTYPVTLDPLEATYEANIKRLRKAWKRRRNEVLRKAVADAVKRLDEQEGDQDEQ